MKTSKQFIWTTLFTHQRPGYQLDIIQRGTINPGAHYRASLTTSTTAGRVLLASSRQRRYVHTVKSHRRQTTDWLSDWRLHTQHDVSVAVSTIDVDINAVSLDSVTTTSKADDTGRLLAMHYASCYRRVTGATWWLNVRISRHLLPLRKRYDTQRTSSATTTTTASRVVYPVNNQHARKISVIIISTHTVIHNASRSHHTQVIHNASRSQHIHSDIRLTLISRLP